MKNAQDRAREEVNAAIARRLRAERERQGLSMTAVAEGAGLSQQMVSYVERRLRQPTVDTLLRLAQALRLDPAGLLAQAATDQPLLMAAEERTPYRTGGKATADGRRKGAGRKQK